MFADQILTLESVGRHTTYYLMNVFGNVVCASIVEDISIYARKVGIVNYVVLLNLHSNSYTTLL